MTIYVVEQAGLSCVGVYGNGNGSVVFSNLETAEHAEMACSAVRNGGASGPAQTVPAGKVLRRSESDNHRCSTEQPCAYGRRFELARVQNPPD